MKPRIFLFTAIMFLFLNGYSKDVEMADTLRDNGKIYVVVTVLSIIFAGIAVYLFNLDRKISKLEKTLRSKKNI